MNRLKHIVNWTIWSLLGLYVLLLGLIHLPLVQERLGRQVAQAASRKLGTKVEVGRLSLGMLNRIIIDDVTIHDQAGEQMLHAGRLSVKIDLLPLLNGRIAISSAQLFGAQANFYKEDAEAKPNFQFALDSLSSDNPDGGHTDLRINSLIIRRSSVAYDRRDAFSTPGRINLNHLRLSDISAHIALKSLTDDSLNVNVKRLALHEQSGLNVERLTLRLKANRDSALLEGLSLQMAQSLIKVDSLAAHYQLDRLEQSLTFTGNLDGTVVNPADLAFLQPQLRHFNESVAINAAISGSGTVISLPRISATAGHDWLTLNASGSFDSRSQGLLLQLPSLRVSDKLFTQLKEAFPDQLPDEVTRLGNVSLTGRAAGHLHGDLALEADVSTKQGRLKTITSLSDGLNAFTAHLETDSLHLGHLLDNEKLGDVATAIDLSGNRQRISAVGTIGRLTYNDYPYQNIQLDGTYETGSIAGKLKVSDPNIETDVEGEVTSDNRTAVRLTGFIRNLNPSALHLTDRWGDATFSAVVDADFTASSLNDAEGTIDLDDFVMTAQDGEYRLDNLHVKSGYNESIHFLNVNGDMGELRLQGTFDWATLPQSFINYTATKLPTLPGLPKTRETPGNNFEATIMLNRTDWMQKLLGIDLTLERPLRLRAAVNDATSRLDIRGAAPAFTLDGSRYEDLVLNLTTLGDTAHTETTLAKLMDNGGRLDLKLKAQAADNQLTTRLQWDNNAPTGDALMAMHGTVNAITQLYTNERGKAEAHVRILPSDMMLRGTTWQMEPCDILYADKRLTVDHFSVAHGEQHLIIDGIASDAVTDTLIADLNQMEVDYILDLVNFHSVSFSGLASGKACATRLFGDFRAWADLTVDQFCFQEGPMGTLLAKAEWSPQDKQIDIEAVADDGADRQTFIDGFISPVRNEMDLYIRARGTSVAFCNSFTDSFLNDVKGQATGDVQVGGDLKHLNLTGDISVEGQLSVTGLGTTYTLTGDTIHFVPNDILFQNIHALDRDGHTAIVNGGVHHNELTDFTFDISVEADHVLAYDFPDFDNSTICGTVYATGTADLSGRPGETVINCNVTPNPGSFFAYNAANPDAISKQEFITWGSSSKYEVRSLKHEERTRYEEGANDESNTRGDLRINFLINATPEATLKVLMDQQTGDYITLGGTGTLRATFYNKGPFEMFGNYNVSRGTYGITIQNIIKKNFTFQDGGTIVFGGDPFEANLDLQAVYTVNGVSLSDLSLGNSFTNNTVRVNCLMNIQGTTGQPRVEFDLDMPTVNSEETQMIRSLIASEQEMNQQVLYLLGIGRFYTQGSNNAGAQQYDQTTLAMQSFLSGTVSTQINEVLSQVIKSNDWNFGANISTGNEGWHNAEYEGLVSGRMLNNRLLINGQFGYRDNATQANPSFIGDFDLRYLLTPSGNLAVKVYNQTNDRYFTRSSLNTQGVGLIMKKDFNGLPDLFHSMRRRKAAVKVHVVQTTESSTPTVTVSP